MKKETFKNELMNLLVPMVKTFRKRDADKQRWFFMDTDQESIIFTYQPDTEQAYFVVEGLPMGVLDFVEYFQKKYKGHEVGYIAHYRKCAERHLLVYDSLYDLTMNN